MRASSPLRIVWVLRSLGACLVGACLLGACSTNSKPPREKTRTESATPVRVAQPSAPQSATYDQAPTREAASAASGQVATSAGLTYNVPDTWKQAPPSSGMRAAQFSLPAAGGEAPEMVLFFFGEGQGGDVEGNLARWAGQIQQPDGSDSRARARIETKTTGPLRVTIMSVDGTYAPAPMMGGAAAQPKTDQRMWAAVIEGPGGPWFWKATGPRAALQAEQANLDALVASMRPAH